MEKAPKKASHPEIKGLMILAITLFLSLCLLSFNEGSPAQNWLGLVGYYIAFTLLYLFGLCSYLITAYLGWMGWHRLRSNKPLTFGIKNLYFSIFIISSCFLLNLLAETHPLENPLIRSHIYTESSLIGVPYPHTIFRYCLGGAPLYYLYKDLSSFNLEHLLSNTGILLTFTLTSLISFILFTNLRMMSLMKGIIQFCKETKHLGEKIIQDIIPAREPRKTMPLPYVPVETIPPVSNLSPMSKSIEEEIFVEVPQKNKPSTPEVLPEYNVTTHLDKKPVLEKIKPLSSKSYEGDFKKYSLPPLTLLTNAKKVDQPSLKKDLKKNAAILESTLESFGIEAKVGQINCGPTITSFEVHPAIGVKVQKIKVLENDIALNLQAKTIRIIAPIPGKAAVGVEVPSLFPQEVGFKEMLSEYHARGKKLHIPIMLGQTVTGENIISDLTKMPHCIIAGATGSGKSVCINSIVMSILMTARPDEVRLLLIDPKKVELSAYGNLPHMIAPVITEAHGAYSALNWLVKEMQHRYEILKRLGLRNIHAFNNRKIDEEKEEAEQIEIPKKMAYFVAIIDEFADLMMASSSDLETPIARIAQMARAVGIHLILATQRPSREVITGLIKANFPTRISFKVASRINSQIILDETGAESLLGNGDLLFLPPGSSQLIRAQGVFVRDEDINQVISKIEEQLPPRYLIKSFDQMATDDYLEASKEPKDDLYNEAYTTVVETGNASTTFLQRKLKIGYARAASLMDELELRGVISPQEGSRPRRLLTNALGKKISDDED